MMAISYFQLVAILISILASVTLGLGVANFIATYFLIFQPAGAPYCGGILSGCVYVEAVIYSFIMPGVWGSIAVFITGIFAIKVVSKMDQWRMIFTTVTFVTTIIFLPAMIVISVVNAVKVAQPPNDWTGAAYNLSQNYPNTTVVLFSLPIAIGSIGGLEFILTAGLLVYVCACLKTKTPSVEPEVKVNVVHVDEQKLSAPDNVVYPAQMAAYAPYGPLPYRRPVPVYADPDAAFYRPGVRSVYPYMPGRYPAAAGPGRPYPMSYMPPGY